MKSVSDDSISAGGTETSTAPAERGGATPSPARAADTDGTRNDWERVAAMDEFKALVTAKLRFIVPATVFFVVYYFALPVLVGYAPGWMEKKVLGVVNLAYLFALSQFFMAWILAALYLRAAGRFDAMAKRILAKLGKEQKGA